MRRLRRLGDTHHAAIRMKVEGIRTPEIARALKVRESTLHIWFSDELVLEEANRLRVKVRERAAELVAERVTSISLEALDELGEIAKMPIDTDGTDMLPYHQKMEAIRAILDRMPLLPTNGEITRRMASGEGENKGGTTNVFNFEGQSDDALRDRARQLIERSELVDGSNVVDSRATDASST